MEYTYAYLSVYEYNFTHFVTVTFAYVINLTTELDYLFLHYF